MDKKCGELREKSKINQDERRTMMNETKVLLKTKGEILRNYEERKYQLLTEKEQFVAANEIIKKQISWCKNQIGTIDFTDLESSLICTREDFNKFAAETKTGGTHVIRPLSGKRVIFELDSSLINTCTKFNHAFNAGSTVPP